MITNEDKYGLRNAPRVRVRAIVEPANGCLVAGRLFPAGESTQVIYADHLDAVIAKTQADEDRTMIENAKRVNASKLEQWKRANPDKKEASYPGHVALEFYAMTGKGIPPIRSIEIVEEMGAPETPENAASTQLAALVAMLTKAINSGSSKSK